MKPRVTKNGELADQELWFCYEDTRQCACVEDGVTVDLSGEDDFEVMVGDYSTVIVGDRCVVIAGMNCEIHAGKNCTIKTKENSIIKTGPR